MPQIESTPLRECDVVMKGGITSGVVYPGALHELARSYRLRSIGGASAGAIGAAFGAAAEHGRETGGFDALARIPADLGGGKLRRLFQATPATRPLLDLAAGILALPRDLSARRRVLAIAGLGLTFGGRAIIPGVVLAVLLLAIGIASGVAAFAGLPSAADILGGAGAIVLGLAGVLLGVVVVAAGILVVLLRLLVRELPANQFGICTGHSEGGEEAFTDWMADRIDELAGLGARERPLTFGDLWGGPGLTVEQRAIDLRMISTCLSQSRPYELPWDGRRFFYRKTDWEKLFPDYVMKALLAASTPPAPAESESTTPDQWRWENQLAQQRGIYRFPEPDRVPVIVATRMSLSFPVLISAVPMLWIEHASPAYQRALERWKAGQDVDPAEFSEGFAPLLFSDGGLTSNFPLHLFDAALPTRPTFAFDLESFPAGVTPDRDESLNSFLPRTNSEGLTVPIRRIPQRGFAALAGFATAAFFTARDWQDKSHLTLPGYRDRIVRVFQSADEGGLNLDMDQATIERLSERGRQAARKLVRQFDEPNYANGATGWENHRWIRYRALLAALPEFVTAVERGRHLVPSAVKPPSIPFRRVATRTLAQGITADLTRAAERVQEAGAAASVADLESAPRPRGFLRRVARL
jgi:predicted acylesterase/phospholipase RssA